MISTVASWIASTILPEGDEVTPRQVGKEDSDPNFVTPKDQPIRSDDSSSFSEEEAEERGEEEDEEEEEEEEKEEEEEEEGTGSDDSVDDDSSEGDYVNVEEILDERRNEGGSLEYLVKFEGFNTPTWEPKRHMDGTIALDEYFRDVKKKIDFSQWADDTISGRPKKRLAKKGGVSKKSSKKKRKGISAKKKKPAGSTHKKRTVQKSGTKTKKKSVKPKKVHPTTRPLPAKRMMGPIAGTTSNKRKAVGAPGGRPVPAKREKRERSVSRQTRYSLRSTSRT